MGSSKSSDDVDDIVSKLVEQTQQLDIPDVRLHAISQARRLIAALETPMETMLRIQWVEV